VSFLQVKFVSLRRVAAGREPDLVVRLDSCEAANKLRGQFGRLVRGVRAGRPLPEYLKGVYLTNVATLSTRVRVDIMRAIADKIRGSQEFRQRHVFCDAYLSQPLLRIRPSTTKSGGDDRGFRGLNYSFVEAVEAFGSRLDDRDLYWSYRRVGRSFKGQLEGLFLILNEAGRARSSSLSPPERSQPSAGQSSNPTTGSNKTGLKRKNDEPSGSYAKKVTGN
jgi:hypothetical protein